MKLSRTWLTSATLSLVLTAGTASPALAQTGRQAAAVPPPPACSALAAQLATQVTSVQSGLAAIPPNPSGVVGLVSQVFGDISALTGAGCLPAVPPTGTGPLTNCVPDTAKLLSDVYAVFTALTKATPDVTGAVSAMTALLDDLTSLVLDTCLALPTSGLPVVPGPTTPRPAVDHAMASSPRTLSR
jgi:hypothetical protein